MTKPLLPASKKANVILYGMIAPIMTALPLLISNPIRYNWTGLLQLPSWRPVILVITCLDGLLCLHAIHQLQKYTLIKHGKIMTIILAVLMVSAICMPYSLSAILLSQLHILLAMAAFVLLQYFLFTLRVLSEKAWMWYLACLFAAILLIVTYDAITGLAELCLCFGVCGFFAICFACIQQKL
ncbi:MAG: hypothetical protein SOI44_01695 [Lactimicrobium sp.]|jgi:hypothetical protein|uniref:hypothetical protein n=1 Tax=Lactimicrobium sp. TaxID=2563780 RepID=UPI002F35D045